MKIRRTHEEWRTLFAEQRASQLSVTQFCKQHNIATKTFYNRRTAIESKKESSFCKATVIKTEFTQTNLVAASGFEFETTLGKLVLPAGTSPEFIARFIKGLSS